MNAREHADTAAHLAEQAQGHHDHGTVDAAQTLAELASTHALTSIALSLADAVDRAAIAELTG